MKNYYIILIMISCFNVSCKDDFTGGISPLERNLKNIKNLRDELTQSKYGWRMIYFSKTDSLLFTNKNEILQKMGNYQKLYGYGGHCFLLKFDDKGIVKIRADYNKETIVKTQESQFEIKQNTFTQLSFTTHNYLHKLVNEEFGGASDFLYVGKDFKGDLIFKTSSYIEPAREHIILQKLVSKDSWDNDIKASYANRKFFDGMKNPQLIIRKGGRIYYKTDVVVKTDSKFEPYQKFLKKIVQKRYYLFQFNTLDDSWLAENKPQNTGLGSGYVGTDKGLTFHTGIRYDKQNVFYDFERKGDKFVCELVRIYDPILKFIYVSKHLYPNGEPTFMLAEIYDKK